MCETSGVSDTQMVRLKNLLENTAATDTLHQTAHDERGCCSTGACGGALLNADGINPIPQQQQVIAEAKDFLNEYYASLKRTGSEEHQARLAEVEHAIRQSGIYRHTIEELEFGAKAAWRNAPRCIGRIQWKNLKVFDARHVTTASEMFYCLLEHLEWATNGGNIRSCITIFPPLEAEGKEFKVWNSQLVQYAGYEQGDRIIGDPSSASFTKYLQTLGWQGKGSQFDVLPLLLQADGQVPEWFEIPEHLVLEVPLRHPEFTWFKELGLKWYCVPAVANMMFDCGGLQYTGAPFNGWYMGTEVGARDLCDVSRYNILPTIAEKMGLETGRLSSLWKDRALLEVNVAVLHSYQADGVTITDHHTASETFMTHMEMEMESRGGCPSDWVWIVPPMSGSVCPVFHQEMVKYILKPSYEYQEKPWEKKSMCQAPDQHTFRERQPRSTKLTFKAVSRCITRLLSLMAAVKGKQPQVTLLYATETGRSTMFAKQAAKVLAKNRCVPKVICMADYDMHRLEKEQCILVVASTFGAGEPPQNGQRFWNVLNAPNAPKNLGNIRYSVLALGSTLYENFCKFGKDVDGVFAKRGATRVCPVQEADEMKGQEAAYTSWIGKVLQGFSNQNPVLDAVKSYRCRFLEDSYFTPTDQILESIHKTKVRSAEVKQIKQLQAEGKTPRYLEASLKGKNKGEDGTYEPGDHLQVFPENTGNDVQMVLSKLKVAPEHYTMPLILEFYDEERGEWCEDERFPGPVSLHQTLSFFLDLMAPACDAFLDGLRKNKVSFKSDYGQQVPVYLEILRDVQLESVPPELLLSTIPFIKPRKYSLSSAPLYEKKYSICFKEIVYIRNDREYFGLTTGFLARVGKGHKIHCSFLEAPTFRLELAGPWPILMLAQGTGVAPFRSFWRHKLALRQNKDNTQQSIGALHLYYGCRSSDIDFLHKKEIQEMKFQGVLEDVQMAFSRDKSMPKTYVQDLLLKNFEKVGNLIYEDHGYIFYCGDIKNWDTICELLTRVLCLHSVLSEQEAKAYVQKMIVDGRLLKDIYME